MQQENPQYRRPQAGDGPALWTLAKSSGRLDTNSPYFYTLWCRDFAETSMLATVDEEIVGFIIGYVRPPDPETCFIWQVGLDERCRLPGVSGELLRRVMDPLVSRGVRYLEATVTRRNRSVIMAVERFAHRYELSARRDILFTSSDFPDDHEEEVLYRVGPFVPGLLSPEHVPSNRDKRSR